MAGIVLQNFAIVVGVFRFSPLAEKKKSLSYRLSRKNNEKFILSGRIFGKEGKL